MGYGHNYGLCCYGLWAMGCALWAMGYGLWAMDYGLWAMGYGLWAMGYGLWAMGYGLWAMGYGLWAMGYGLWAMGYGLWACTELRTISFDLCFLLQLLKVTLFVLGPFSPGVDCNAPTALSRLVIVLGVCIYYRQRESRR